MSLLHLINFVSYLIFHDGINGSASHKTCVDYISKENGVSPNIAYNELNEVLKNQNFTK